MKFLYPEFLYGLVTLAIPIIIHLFNFRKSKKIYFSSTRFLKNIKKSTSQKLKLKHYLILLSRLLFLAFLVLAFAQPYLPSANKNPQAESVFLYLDNSFSMSNRIEGNQSSLDLGIEHVDMILDLYPTNTTYKFLTNEFAPFSNTLKSRDEVAELLTEIRFSNISRSVPEAYSRLSSQVLQQSAEGKDLYIISDFQKSTAGDLGQLKFDSVDQVNILPMSFSETKNIFIDSVYLSNPFLVTNEKNQLNVIVKNSGFEDATEIPFRLFINDIQTASNTINILAGSSENLSFEISYNLNDINKCRINFEDYPVTFDNDFYFVLKLENKIDVLEIKESDDMTEIEHVYGNTSLFNFSSQITSNIDYSLIAQFDLVIVHGIDEIDNSLISELQGFIKQNGSLLLIPGEKPNINSYRNIISSVKKAANDSTRIKLGMPDLSDPFYENIFESSNERIEMPDALPVLSWTGDQMQLLKLRNDQNFLGAFSDGGLIFIFASPLSEKFSNFSRHALFVPVMYRIASMSKQSFDRPYYVINESVINLKLDSLQQQDIFSLKNERIELIPNQRISSNELILEVPKYTLSPGFYNLDTQGQSRTIIAFNIDKKESYLEQMTFTDISKTFAPYENISLFEVNDADNFSKEVKKNKFGVPLWKYAIILSLIFYWQKSC